LRGGGARPARGGGEAPRPGRAMGAAAASPLQSLGLQRGPVTAKESGDGRSDALGLLWAFSAMQGWRPSMEDAHFAIPQLGAHASSSRARARASSAWSSAAMFGVLDGHGGEQVARFCERHLPTEIAGSRLGEDTTNSLVNAFHRMDELLVSPDSQQELVALSNGASTVWGQRQVQPENVGCTAVVCCVRPDTYIVANAGDSRAVLCRRGKAIDLSEDHKPNLPTERSRIEKAGGFITEKDVGLPSPVYRVNGDLTCSRAIGDLRHKRNTSAAPQDQVVISTPDVRVVRREPGDEFAVLACDGIWDVLSSQQVIDLLRPQVAAIREGKMRASAVVEGLLDYCLTPDPAKTRGIGSDNMTVVLVTFLGGGQHAPEGGAPAPGSSLCSPGLGSLCT